MTAVPATGYQFDHWEGAALGSENPIQITMSFNKSVTAVMALIPNQGPLTFTLTTSVTPQGSGSITQNGTGTYSEGATVSLEAAPSLGFTFANWSGDATGSIPDIELLMNNNKVINANFQQDTSDEDNDGLTAYEELSIYGTDPTKADTDEDGIKDGIEVETIFNPTINDSKTFQLLAENPELYLNHAAASQVRLVYPRAQTIRDENWNGLVSVEVIPREDSAKDLEFDTSDINTDSDTIALRVFASESIELLRIPKPPLTIPSEEDQDGDKIPDYLEVGTIFSEGIDDTTLLKQFASRPSFYLDLILSLLPEQKYPESIILRDASGGFPLSVKIEGTYTLRTWWGIDLSEAYIEGNKVKVFIPASELGNFFRVVSSN